MTRIAKSADQPYARACDKARKLLLGHGFRESQVQRPNYDCYHRPYPIRVNTMLRAYVNRADFEVQLIFEEDKAARVLCTTADLAEVQNLLETSRWRQRFVRK